MKCYSKPITSMIAMTMAQQVLAGSPATSDVQIKSGGEIKPGEKQYAV